MGDRYDDSETDYLGDDAETDYLGDPQYAYTEEEPPGSEAAAGEGPADEAGVEADEALTKEEQDKRVRKVAAIGAIAGLLVGAVAMLVIVALAGGDPAPEDGVVVDEADLAELQAALEERDAQIEALEAQLSEAQATVEDRDAEIERLRQQVGEEETELAELEAALEEQRAALERRAAALDEREQALDEREAEPPPAEPPPAETPDPGNGLPDIDEDEAEDLIERIIDGIRDLFN